MKALILNRFNTVDMFAAALASALCAQGHTWEGFAAYLALFLINVALRVYYGVSPDPYKVPEK